MTNGSRSEPSLQRPTQIGHDFPHIDMWHRKCHIFIAFSTSFVSIWGCGVIIVFRLEKRPHLLLMVKDPTQSNSAGIPAVTTFAINMQGNLKCIYSGVYSNVFILYFSVIFCTCEAIHIVFTLPLLTESPHFLLRDVYCQQSLRLHFHQKHPQFALCCFIWMKSPLVCTSPPICVRAPPLHWTQKYQKRI